MGRARARLAVVALVAAGMVTVPTVGAEAVRAPRTLAHTAAVGAAPVEAEFPIDYVGVQWDGDAHGGEIRFRHGNQWDAWQPLLEDGVEVSGRFASALVSGSDADAYQVRAPGDAVAARAVAINTTDGPPVVVGEQPAGVAGAATSIIPRLEWGADESLRFDSSGNEIWPATYYPAQKLTVHHTATQNNDPDPAATVRAIYRYHTVDRGFGDIGYQYLADEQGHVYEGRWSGSDPDPGHDANGDVVTAAHVGGWNSGNVGIALLGTLTDQPPTDAARSSLESILATLATRHAIDPGGSSTYTNPVNGAQWTGPNIPGHRDFAATRCPGGAMYALLPTIRSDVAVQTSPTTTTTTSTTTTTTATTAPADTQAPVITNVRVANVTSNAASILWTTNEPGNSRVDFWVRSSNVLTVQSATLVKSHDVRLTGLKAGTKYSYQVYSADASSNLASSGKASFRTASGKASFRTGR